MNEITVIYEPEYKSEFEMDIDALQECFRIVKQELDPEEYTMISEQFTKYTFEPFPFHIYERDLDGWIFTMPDHIKITLQLAS